MAVKAILSDLGGVLIEYSFHLVASELGRLASVDSGVLAQKLVADDAWVQFEVGRLTEPEFCSHLRQQCGLDLTDDEMIGGWNSIYIGVNAPVERMLRDIARRGMRVVAVTNTNVTHQRVWEDRFASSVDFFAAVYSSWELRARKPEPAFFEHVLQSEQVAPHEALFIDDLDVHVEMARNLGLDVILYTSADGLRDGLASRGLLAAGPSP